MRFHKVEDFAKWFWSKVKIGNKNECWQWTGTLDSYGYGRAISNPLKTKRTNRIAYELTKGPLGVDEGRHTCDHRDCCNPDHIIPGTQADNVRDALERNRFTIGEKNGQSKLTESEAQAILDSDEPTKVLALRYDLSTVRVNQIKSGKAWKHLRR